MPLVVLLEHLARAGWKRASSVKDSLAIHTLETPRVMHLSGSNAQDKAYLQCLACLEDILSPSLPSLAAGQPAAYYQKILQSELELAALPPPAQAVAITRPGPVTPRQRSRCWSTPSDPSWVWSASALRWVHVYCSLAGA